MNHIQKIIQRIESNNRDFRRRHAGLVTHGARKPGPKRPTKPEAANNPREPENEPTIILLND